MDLLITFFCILSIWRPNVSANLWTDIWKEVKDETISLVDEVKNLPDIILGCDDGQYQCNNGRCIPQSYLCDGDRDCSGGDDEENCGNNPSLTKCSTAIRLGIVCTCDRCDHNEFECNNGRCKPQSYVCDGDRDCSGGEDEENCVNGGWSDVGNWGACSVSCGRGTRSRMRRCDNPSPQHGGAQCVGESTITGDCVMDDCPVNGGWSDVGNWGACSVSCGRGTRSRTRRCDNPSPQHGGAQCVGESRLTGDCVMDDCPVNGGWRDIGDGGACSVSCGRGTRSRVRRCDNPSPQHGGAQCVGESTITGDCVVDDCQVNGDWRYISDWGACSVSCGRGTRSRVRRCDNPSPQHGGAECVGESRITGDCVMDDCPVCADLRRPDGTISDCNPIGEEMVCDLQCADNTTSDFYPMTLNCGPSTDHIWNPDNPEELPKCVAVEPPHSVMIEELSSHTAHVSWIGAANSHQSQQTFLVNFKSLDAMAYSSSPPIEDSGAKMYYTLHNLEANTVYSITVISKGSYRGWKHHIESNVFTFKTPTEVMNVNNVGLIAGSVSAGVVIFVIVFLVGTLLFCKCRHSPKPAPANKVKGPDRGSNMVTYRDEVEYGHYEEINLKEMIPQPTMVNIPVEVNTADDEVYEDTIPNLPDNLRTMKVNSIQDTEPPQDEYANA